MKTTRKGPSLTDGTMSLVPCKDSVFGDDEYKILPIVNAYYKKNSFIFFKGCYYTIKEKINQNINNLKFELRESDKQFIVETDRPLSKIDNMLLKYKIHVWAIKKSRPYFDMIIKKMIKKIKEKTEIKADFDSYNFCLTDDYLEDNSSYDIDNLKISFQYIYIPELVTEFIITHYLLAGLLPDNSKYLRGEKTDNFKLIMGKLFKNYFDHIYKNTSTIKPEFNNDPIFYDQILKNIIELLHIQKAFV